jgi:peptidoglycan/LPS O-acetylase OafA/YrhL
MVKSETNKIASGELISFPTVRRTISGHIPALDGIRGLGMLVVMICHFCTFPPSSALVPGFIQNVHNLGWPSMESFFALSGFLITGILLDTKGAENYFSSFYIRRALRILPLYYGTLFVLFVISPPLGRWGLPHLESSSTAHQVWFWFYVANWLSLRGQLLGTIISHFWSLAVEEQFYLVWPCVVFLTSRRALAKLCLALPLASAVIRIVLFLKGVDGGSIPYLTVAQFDGLALGALAALIVREENWLRRISPYVKPIAYAALAVLVILGLAEGGLAFNGWSFILGNLPLGILFADLLIMIVLKMGSNSRWLKPLNAGWIRSCGDYSYAMYVFHWPLVWFYSRRVAPLTKYLSFLSSPALIALGLLQLLTLCLVTYGVGKLSWWGFEGPIHNLRKYFKIRWPKPKTPG